MSDAVPFVLFGFIALTALVGVVGCSRFGRPARVEMARRAGDSEESIQRQRATIKRVRNLFLMVLVVTVLGAVEYLLAAHPE